MDNGQRNYASPPMRGRSPRNPSLSIVHYPLSIPFIHSFLYSTHDDVLPSSLPMVKSRSTKRLVLSRNIFVHHFDTEQKQKPREPLPPRARELQFSLKG